MINETFELLERICAGQGVDLAVAIEDDAADDVIVKCVVRNPNRFLDDVQNLTADSSVTITLSRGDDGAVITRTPQRTWRLESSSASLRDRFPSADVRDTWGADELSQALNDRGSDCAATVRVEKALWRAEVESQTGRSSWIGYSQSSFVKWLDTRTWRQVAKELFARERSLIVIYTWEGSAVSLGARLVVCGSKDLSPTELVVPAELRWPQEVEPELLRAAHLLPTTDSYEMEQVSLASGRHMRDSAL